MLPGAGITSRRPNNRLSGVSGSGSVIRRFHNEENRTLQQVPGRRFTIAFLRENTSPYDILLCSGRITSDVRQSRIIMYTAVYNSGIEVLTVDNRVCTCLCSSYRYEVLVSCGVGIVRDWGTSLDILETT